MSIPAVVQSALGDEQVAAQVQLGGEDQLYVTPSRILIYRGEGLLSDETIEEYAHRAERVVVNRGRRKAKITLEHDLEGERTFSVPPSRLDDVLHPVLAGVLSAAGVTDPGETVKQTYRFSELTLILTSKRLVKHIGNPVWDQDYEEFRFEDTTGLTFEEGSVATQIVLEVDGRRERIKAPNEEAPEVRAHLEEALFDFYDVASLEEFQAAVAEAEGEASGSAPDPEESADGNAGVAFESGLSPLQTGGSDDGDDGDETGGAVGTDSDPDSATTADATAGASAGEAFGVDQIGGPGDGETPGEGFGDEVAGDSGTATDETSESGTTTGETGGGAAEGTAAQGLGGAGSTQDPDPAAAGGTTAEPAGESSAIDDASVEPGGDYLDDGELSRRLDEIASSVNKQNELLKRHQQTMEKLIDELQRMGD